MSLQQFADLLEYLKQKDVQKFCASSQKMKKNVPDLVQFTEQMIQRYQIESLLLDKKKAKGFLDFNGYTTSKIKLDSEIRCVYQELLKVVEVIKRLKQTRGGRRNK
jgi:hypothetical protein